MAQVWTDRISNLRITPLRRARRLVLEFFEKCAPPRHNIVSSFALKVIKITSLKGNRESKYINALSTRFLPADPLSEGERFLPTVVICAPKDVEILPYSLLSVVAHLSNGKNLFLLVPSDISQHVNEILNDLEIDAEVITDEALIKEYLKDNKASIEKAARMQLLKLLSVISQESRQVLVVDGDTIFLKGRNWVQENKTAFPISQEFLPRHTNFSRQKLGLKSESGLGFVTHHQVVCKDCVEQIISRAGGIESLADKMQSAFGKTECWNDVYPSEWQFLGEFAMETERHEVVPVRFANIGLNRELINLEFSRDLNRTKIQFELEKLAKSVPKLYSISLHSYK